MLTLLCSVMTWAEVTTHKMSSYSSLVITDDQSIKWDLSASGGTGLVIGASNALPSDLIEGSTSKRGVSVNSANSAIKVTSQTSFSDITKVVVYASANGSTTGDVSVKVGATTMTAPTSVSLANGARNASFEFKSNTPLTGVIEVTLPYTETKTVWFGGVIVTTTSGSDTPVTEKYSYTLETIGQGTTVFKDANGNTIDENQQIDKDTKLTPTFTPAEGYEFTSWEYYSSVGEWKSVNGNEFTITKDVKFRVTFTETQSGGDDDSQSTDVSFSNLGYSSWGKSANFSGTTYDEVSQTVDNVTFTYTRNTGSLYANSSAIRFYKANELKFEAPTGYNIVSIVFTGSTFKNDVTTDVDKCTSSTSALSWAGKASSVTFTRPSDAANYITLSGVDVKLEAISSATPSITISAAGVATYYNSTYSYKMPKGLTGYWVSAAYGEDGIGLLELTDSYPADVVVPAGEALIIKGAAGTYELEAGTTDYKPYGDNRLKGTDEAATTTGGDVYYKLAKDPESGLGFYWGAENGAAFTNGAHKAYLALTSEEAGVSGAKGFVLNFDEATAISTVKTSVNANVAYNLAGQRVNANTKGIVIMNGKKYLNK